MVRSRHHPVVVAFCRPLCNGQRCSHHIDVHSHGIDTDRFPIRDAGDKRLEGSENRETHRETYGVLHGLHLSGLSGYMDVKRFVQIDHLLYVGMSDET